MMDLEHGLEPIVEHAPEPPPLERIQARAGQRRRRRRAARAVVVVVVAAVAAGSVLVLARTDPPTVSTGPAASATRSLTITSLYGTTIRVDTKGVTLGAPRLDATVQADDTPFPGPVSIVATRTAAPETPAGAPTYPTADGHELRAVHTDAGGDQLVGSWSGWSMGVTVEALSDTQRARLASLLRFRERGGYLVVDPVAPLRLRPSVGAEIALDGIDIDASTYPSGCPTPAASGPRTAQGFAVDRIGVAASWCDTIQRLRILVQPPASVDDLMETLRVTRIS